MADRTKIEWADATVNAINGCRLVDEGCRNCYAARLAGTRMRTHPTRAGLARQNAAGEFKFTGEVRLNEKALLQPLSWAKPRAIFWNAHGDTFAENVPDEWIDRMMAVIALTPQHRHLVLTKRPERARAYLEALVISKIVAAGRDLFRRNETDVLFWKLPLPNLWLGTSVSDQASADERIPHLLAAPAAVRFLSAEPLLGPVDLTQATRRVLRHPSYLNLNLHQVIVGGESGPGARPMHPDWARSLRDQCQAAGVAFFFKQWGEWLDEQVAAAMHLAPGPEMFDRYGSPKGPKWHPYEASDRNGGAMFRVGKARAGRRLDGQEWSEVPG